MGYLRGGPAGGRREPGSRGASVEFRACVSGGAGPWRERRVAAPRLLLGLPGRAAAAGVQGRAGRALAACPGWSVQIARPAADSLPACFENRIQRLPVAASGTLPARATAGKTNENTGRVANGGGDRRRR